MQFPTVAEPSGTAAPLSPNRGPRPAYILGGALLLMLAGSGVYFSWRLGRLEAELSGWRAAMENELAEWRETAAAQRAGYHEHLEALRGELAATRSDALASSRQAKAEAEKHAENLVSRLAHRQKEAERRLARELAELKETAGQAGAQLAQVSTEVSSTRTEVSGLNDTVAGLRRAAGDIGVLSGLVATNARELAALKKLGERRYFEFAIRAGERPRQFGGVRIALKAADPRRRRFTIELYAADRKWEKKDREVNEPIQFYDSRSRIPCEIVVQEVARDRITGYLAVPDGGGPPLSGGTSGGGS